MSRPSYQSGSYASNDAGTVTITRLSDDVAVVSYTGPAATDEQPVVQEIAVPACLLLEATAEFRHARAA
jgi:hypothetical protein